MINQEQQLQDRMENVLLPGKLKAISACEILKEAMYSKKASFAAAKKNFQDSEKGMNFCTTKFHEDKNNRTCDYRARRYSRGYRRNLDQNRHFR